MKPSTPEQKLILKRARERRYYKKYRAKKILQVLAWQAKHPEKLKAYSKSFYQKNKAYWIQWHRDRVSRQKDT